MTDKLSLGTFLKKYGTNDKCLEAIFKLRYPNDIYCTICKQNTKFYKISGRQVYQDSFNHQISPLAGTIFEKSSTPLQYWFYAIFIMAVTRSGVSAKQLQRELGVTYKTAWRMFQQVRKLMAQDNGLLDGVVEIDETYVGGKGKNRAKVANFNEIPKEIVWGAVERNGKAYLKHIPNTGKWTLIQQVKEHINPKAFLMTDELPAYKRLYEFGFDNHQSVTHSQREYVRGNVYNNNVENIWSHLKRGIYGVYRVVSKKYLQAYVDEYAFRYNNRNNQEKMFETLLKQVAEVKVLRTTLTI